MKLANAYPSDYSVYPGTYVPLLKEEEIKEELQKMHEGISVLPPVNVKEYADSYKVEVAIPGVKREEFLIHGDKNILSVKAMQLNADISKQESFQLHEFNYHCFGRRIILPENADAASATAECTGGILSLYVPKTSRNVQNRHTLVVVY